jgi:hypothetical protein
MSNENYGGHPLKQLASRWSLRTHVSGERADNLSALAILETLIAASIGILLTYYGYFWMLWASIFVTPFVHLRSPSSVASGVQRLNKYWGRKPEPTKLEKLLIILSLALPLVTTQFLGIGWGKIDVVLTGDLAIGRVLLGLCVVGTPLAISSCIVSPAGGLSLFSSLLSMICIIATAVWVFEQGYDYYAIIETGLPALVISALMVTSNVGGQSTRNFLSHGVVVLALPAIIIGVLARLLFIRIAATTMHLRTGMTFFTKNWTSLISRTDFYTPPEVLPGLPVDHNLRVEKWRQRTRVGNGRTVRTVAHLMQALFIPSIAYRITLKSSFFFYVPLIWIATRPTKLTVDANGNANWNRSLGRTPIDLACLLTAFLSAALLIYRAWDQESYLAATKWANDVGAPNFWPMLATGITPDKVSIWHWLPGLAAMLSLAVLFWCWNISFRIEKTSGSAKPWEVWSISKLNSLKNTLSLLTLAVGLLVVLAYSLDPCRVPDLVARALDLFFGSSCQITDDIKT